MHELYLWRNAVAEASAAINWSARLVSVSLSKHMAL